VRGTPLKVRTYGDWGVEVTGFGAAGSLDPTATLEVLLHLTR
jgi:hypothetical protein